MAEGKRAPQKKPSNTAVRNSIFFRTHLFDAFIVALIAEGKRASRKNKSSNEAFEIKYILERTPFLDFLCPYWPWKNKASNTGLRN